MRGVGRKLGLSLATLGAVGAFMAVAASASAAAITVTSANDPSGTSSQCTLRQAIDSANTDATPSGSNCTAGSGTDTITFAPSILPAHITLTGGELGLGTPMTIQGSGAANQVIVDANGASRVLSITDADVTLSRLTVTGGHVNCPCSSPISSSAFYGGAGIRALLTDLPVPTVSLDHAAVTGNSVSTVFNGGTSPVSQANGAGVLTNLHLVVKDTTISGNSLSTTTTGDASTVTGAAAAASGPGIAFLPPGSDSPTPLEVDNSTISGNTATATSSNSFTGGAFATTRGAITVFSGGTASVTSSTIANNTLSSSAAEGATETGGGIYVDSSPVTVTSDTITGNDAATGANVLGEFGAAVTLTNTVVASPVNGSNCGGVTSAGHNFSSDASCDPTGTGDVQDTDPHLRALGDYGGPTQTRPPEPRSGTDPTVIDKGVAASRPTDQRGLTRTVNYNIANATGGDGTDIGAVEIQNATATSTNPTSPADSDTVHVMGTAEPGSFALLFIGAGCLTSPVDTQNDSVFASPGLVANGLAENTATTFSTAASYGNISALCSPTTITYQRRPGAPTLISTDPASGGDNNAPKLIGTALTGTTVDIYTVAGCTGAIAGTGTGDELSGAGIPVSVADNSTTTFYAKASGVGGTSDCSAGLSYSEVTPLPPAPPNTNPTPTSPTPAQKKCKKGFKLKTVKGKKKCVRKKKK